MGNAERNAGPELAELEHRPLVASRLDPARGLLLVQPIDIFTRAFDLAAQLADGHLHRLAGIAPTWGLAVTLGTASSGLSALNPSSPLWHQRQVFSGGVNLHGRGKSGGTGGC